MYSNDYQVYTKGKENGYTKAKERFYEQMCSNTH
jgi:hypothetical protein